LKYNQERVFDRTRGNGRRFALLMWGFIQSSKNDRR
jgi:hypothetical protein